MGSVVVTITIMASALGVSNLFKVISLKSQIVSCGKGKNLKQKCSVRGHLAEAP